MRYFRSEPITRATGLAGLCLLIAGSLAACGSSGGSGGSAASGSSASTTAKAPTGSPIKIGVITALTGSQASTNVQAGVVASAWEQYVNKVLGGIGGHPVQVSVKDDGGDPVKGQAVSKELVSAGVVAVVAGSDNVLPAYDADFISANIPVLAGSSSSSEWYTKAGLFATGTSQPDSVTNQVGIAKDFAHATKFANLYCAEVAACAQAGPPIQAAAQKLGVGYVGLAISSTAPSYTAQCLALQQQKVDYIQLNLGAAAGAKIVQDCQSQGYNPTFGANSFALGPDLLKVPNLTLYGVGQAFMPVGNSPVVTTFRNAMTKYAANDNWSTGSGPTTWDGLEAIRKALASASPTATPTAQDVLTGLYAFKDENLGGLLSNKISFTEGKPIGFGSHPCYFVTGIKDGKIVSPNNLAPVCPSTS